MIYGSVCSGIEAATVAWHPLGWKPAFFSEIEKFPRQVLAHHYPKVPLHGDFTTIQKGDYAAIDLLVGGTPCQSFSVAGLRKGLDDPRGNLMLEFGALARRLGPKWLVWENVPGVLSSNGGRDFGTFLGMLAELGYGFAYRVLDAQYFGVPQRRRRVFVVGCIGDWRSAAAVLFERHSLSGNIAPSREAREEVTSSAGASIGSGNPTIGTLMANAGTKLWLGNQEALSGDYHILQPTYGIAGNIIGRKPENGGNGDGWSEEVGYTLKKTDQHAVAHTVPTLTSNGDAHSGFRDEHGLIGCFKGGQGAKAGGIGYDENVSPTLSAADSGSNRTPALMQGMAVRRLTPIECERLQGFPDNYTKINDKTPDSPRYKALGNSMAVPCMRWIGERIQKIEDLNK